MGKGEKQKKKKKNEPTQMSLFLLTASLWPQVAAHLETGQRSSLMEIYEATGGPGWTNSTGWGSERCHCEWFGVGCVPGCLDGVCTTDVGGECMVESLKLPLNNLAGTLPDAAFAGLTSTAILHIYKNPKLTGTIPSSLGLLPVLAEIDLNSNSLGGTLPFQAGTFLAVRDVRLWGNKLGGPIGFHVFELPRLEVLDLTNNELTGAFPTDVSTPAPLTYLSIYNNSVSGPLPEFFCSFKNLSSLGLGDNLLTGTVPSCLSNLASLIRIYFSSNKFSGPIPDIFGNMNSLALVQATAAGFSGPLPNSLGLSTSLEFLDLANNQISSLPDDIGGWRNLLRLDLSGNALTGPLTAIIDKFAAVTQRSSEADKTRIFSLQNLLLNRNQLTGSIPPLPSSGLASLQVFNVAYNSLSGPISEMSGGDTAYFDFSYNLWLKGCIPDSMGGNFPLVSLNFEQTALRASYCNQTTGLPKFLRYSDKSVQRNSTDAYVCLVVTGDEAHPTLRVTLEPEYFNFANCRCLEGFYARDTNQCELCDARCECSNGTVRGCDPTNSLAICPPVEGGTACNPTMSTEYSCLEGYSGRLCAECEAGYGHVSNGQCHKCSTMYSALAICQYVVSAVLLFLYLLIGSAHPGQTVTIMIFLCANTWNSDPHRGFARLGGVGERSS
eukprot:TRINITY_DN3265_c1_g1_i4.p1 TRINITY_DN3265_c1_g1~~TRINITY_DN3265_c1_g1_i4.p1  ORF type:complete len:672 (-),score=142.67 TRINITY_DN3265_c1_g1_i4:1076-3070(-)